MKLKMHHCWHCEYGPCTGACEAAKPMSEAALRDSAARRAAEQLQRRIKNAAQLEEIERLGT